MRRNWNFIKFLIDYTFFFPTQLYSQDSEVCASKVQGIKETFLIPIKKITMKVSNRYAKPNSQFNSTRDLENWYCILLDEIISKTSSLFFII